MDFENFPGTGNSKLSPDHRKRLIDLNNVVVTRYQINDFFERNSIEPCVMDFSVREYKYRWGTAYLNPDRVILYRWSVGTFLHEFAHIVTCRDHTFPLPGGSSLMKKFKPHGVEFAVNLERLIDTWEICPLFC